MPESHQDVQTRKVNIPSHPIISDCTVKSVAHGDTLDRVAGIIALLQELNFSDGMSANAGTGLYWILEMLESTVKYISDSSVADD